MKQYAVKEWKHTNIFMNAIKLGNRYLFDIKILKI